MTMSKKDLGREVLDSKDDKHIITLRNISDLLKYDETSTLFVFDLDNTLIFPENIHLGGSEWFGWLMNVKKISKEEVVPLWLACNSKSSLVSAVPVEGEETIRFLGSMKSAKSVICTFRPDSLKNSTLRQLKQSKLLEFFKSSSSSRRKLHVFRKAMYYDDISTLFTDGEEKGEMITKLVSKKFKGIRKIIFVDDYLPNIKKIRDFYFYKRRKNNEKIEEKEENELEMEEDDDEELIEKFEEIKIFHYTKCAEREFSSEIANEEFEKCKKKLFRLGKIWKKKWERRRKELVKLEENRNIEIDDEENDFEMDFAFRIILFLVSFLFSFVLFKSFSKKKQK